MYRCMSHSTTVAKTWGGGCKNLIMGFCLVLVEPFPKPLESCTWDGGDVSSFWSKMLHSSS